MCVCSVQKVSSHVIWKIDTFFEEDTRNIIPRTVTLQSPSKQARSSPNHHQLPCCILLNLPYGLKSLPFQRWFQFWEKPELTGHQIWAKEDWVTQKIWCFTKIPCGRHNAWAGTLWWWRCQSPVAHSCSLLNHLNSFCGGLFKLKAKFDADSLLYLLSHFECDGHTVHMPIQQYTAPTD